MVDNNKNLRPTFETVSYVDVTMGKGLAVREWLLEDEETLSDHKYLPFSVGVKALEQRQRMVYDFDGTRWKKFRENLRERMNGTEWLGKSTVEKAEILQEACKWACQRHIKKKVVSQYKSVTEKEEDYMAGD